MAEIGRIISSTLNIDEVYLRVVEEARKLIPFDGMAINIVREGMVTVPHVSGLGVPGCQPGDTFALAGSATGEAAQRRSGLIIPLKDGNELPARFPTLSTAFEVGIRTLIVVPLFSKDQTIGAIHFRSTKPNAYSEQDLKLAEGIANQIAGAVANAQLFGDRQRTEEALRESETKYRRLYESMMDAFCHVDMAGRILEANRAYQAMVGYSEKELRRLTYIDLTPEKWHALEGRIVQEQILVQGHSEVYEKEYRRKDGTIFPVELRTFLIRDEGGIPVGMWAVVRDITERKRTEEALRESEEKFRNLVETTSDWIWETDAEGNYSYSSPRIRDLLGYEPDEVIGRKPFDFMPPDEAKRLEAEFARIHSRHQPFFNLENVNLRKDGNEVILETSGVPRLDSRGRFPGYRGIDRDITERKRVEEALRESEKKYRSVIENIQDVFYRSDLKGWLLMGSPSGAKMFGYDTVDEMIGLPLDSFWPDPRGPRANFLAQIKATGSVKDFEAVLKRNDGTTFDASFTTHFYYDDKGNFLGTEGIIRDITERKRAEEERSNLEAQMREVQKLESLGVLAGGIAHDFNNLLMAILGNADLALLSLTPAAPAHQHLVEIVNASQRAADLCRQMLAYSGKGRFVLGRYDLSDIVQEMAHMLQVSVSKKATLRYQFATDLPPVEADATQLRQVVMNLITNASDALGDASGVIEVSSGVMECDRAYLSESYLDDKLPEGRYVYLEVSDTGCGMDAETRSRIFDPFFTTKFTGRGLGLAAVLGIVRGHQGAVKVHSEPGKGTTFRILFPAAEWTPADRTRITEQSILPPGGGTILLIDDDQYVLDVGSRMLERLGYTVLMASDGQEGLEVFRERAAEIDCVLLDLTMPRLSGEEVFREIRRIRTDVPVVLSSGYNEQDVTQRFVGQGLAGFAQKPYTLEKLREILGHVLG